MKKRVTVHMDDDVHDKLRKLQGEMIQKSGDAVSFSTVINEVLKKSKDL